MKVLPQNKDNLIRSNDFYILKIHLVILIFNENMIYYNKTIHLVYCTISIHGCHFCY